MRVTFKDVLNRAYTTLFTDYKLDNLIKMDEQAFYTFLGGFLCNSIDIFDGTLTDLSYHSEVIKDEMVMIILNMCLMLIYQVKKYIFFVLGYH